MNIFTLQLVPVTMIAYRSQYGSMVIIAQSESAGALSVCTVKTIFFCIKMNLFHQNSPPLC